jgi:hypothetical protein
LSRMIGLSSTMKVFTETMDTDVLRRSVVCTRGRADHVCEMEKRV